MPDAERAAIKFPLQCLDSMSRRCYTGYSSRGNSNPRLGFLRSLAVQAVKGESTYVSNEKADSPSGDGVSNRQSVPVEAGNRSPLVDRAKAPPSCDPV
jgi:hypothetical protein